MRKKKDPEEVVETGDLLAPYEATRVPSGTASTGLPARSRSSRRSKVSVSADAQPPVLDVTGDERASSAEPVPAADPVIDLREAEPTPSGSSAVDRRFEPRYSLTLPVAATQDRGGGPIAGFTVNVSRHGLLLLMPDAPPDTHVDVVVGDERTSAAIWAQVVAHRTARAGDHYWHVRVVSSDDAWTPLVASA